jgi:hypothetical protein
VSYAAEAKSDEELCGIINAYWRKHGIEARARVEMRSYVVPPLTIKSADGTLTHLPSRDFTRREITSDLVNGGLRRVT